MQFKHLALPAVIEIGSRITSNLPGLLASNDIDAYDLVLFTQEELIEHYRTGIHKPVFSEVVIIHGGIYEEKDTIVFRKDISNALFVAFGGGSVIDFVKLLAKEYDRPYLTIPSTLSNDSIYSPIARLSCEGVKTSFGVKEPIGIIIDTEIIKHSPTDLLLAGVGDLVSNLSAVQDCELSIQEGKDTIDKSAILLSKLSVEGILKYSYADLHTDNFIKKLASGLITSGLAMKLAGNSRPASGAEHLISHAIDQHFPERSTYHGIQVAWAHLLIEQKFRNNGDDINNYYERIGIKDAIRRCPSLTDEFFFELIPYARAIRSRYTILDKV